MIATPPAVAPPPPDWPVAELVVSAVRGPVFWRVARGGGEVWILGVPEVFARDQRWDDTRLRRLLDGAQELLTPPAYRLRGGTWRGRAARLSPLETRIDPELAMRFGRARSEAGRPAERYARLTLADAAHRLRTDLEGADGLTRDQPDRDVIGLAGRRFLPVHAVARYDTPFAESLAAEGEGARCVEGALADAAFARDHALAASRAWAVGDLKTVRDNTAKPQVAACLDAAPAFRAIGDRAVGDTTAAIEAALDRGGRTVAMLTLGALLNPHGVLSRLRADGAEVTAPDAAASLGTPASGAPP